jgi:hypothetical protein
VKVIQNDYSVASGGINREMEKFEQVFEDRSADLSDLIEQKTNEMLFAVNAAIKGQIEMLEIGPFMTRDALNSLEKLKLRDSKVAQKIRDLKDSVIQIAASLDGPDRVDGLTFKNASAIIRLASERNRRTMEDMKSKFDKLSRDLGIFKDSFESCFLSKPDKSNKRRKDHFF